MLGLSEFAKKLLKQCKTIKKPDAEATVDVKRFMRQSSDFPLEVGAVSKLSSSTSNLQCLSLSQFGVQSCRVMSQQGERHEAIGQQIASTYPLIHERTLALYLQFLEHKCQWGKSMFHSELHHMLNCIHFQATPWSCPFMKASRCATLCSVC